jgi:hypothetical protein
MAGFFAAYVRNLKEMWRPVSGYCDPDPYEYKPARQNHKVESY